jgi:uracil-DNA glycosylase
MTAQTPLVQMIRDIRNTLGHLKQNGCTGFDCSPDGLKTLAHLGVPVPQGPAGQETLAAIRADLGDCTRCPLCRSRTHIVFGEGSPTAQLVFVGEGPGSDEDRSGHPFVGAAGQLLTKIIGAMNLSREAVYIGNIVKCRPPGNRNPEPDEIRQCLPFLKRQLAAIRPRVVCALGSVAARTLLETDTSISRLRGQFHEAMGIPVMPTFHPAYLLRNPEKKRAVWNDVQQIMKMLD